MTGAVIAASGAAADPSASWLKFVTIGINSSFDYGYSSLTPVFGSLAFTDRVGGQIATRFVLSTDVGEFNFQIDESNSSGFSFTDLVVELIPGFSYLTLPRSAAIEYSGFPIKGWIWSGYPQLTFPWGLAGEVRQVQIRR